MFSKFQLGAFGLGLMFFCLEGVASAQTWNFQNSPTASQNRTERASSSQSRQSNYSYSRNSAENSARSSNQTQRNNNPQTGYSGFNGRGSSGSWGNSQVPSANTRNSNNRTMDNRARTPTRVPTPTRNSYEGTIDPTLLFADY